MRRESKLHKKNILLFLSTILFSGCLATFETAQIMKKVESEKLFAIYMPLSYRAQWKIGVTDNTDLELLLDGMLWLPPFPHSAYLVDAGV